MQLRARLALASIGANDDLRLRDWRWSRFLSGTAVSLVLFTVGLTVFARADVLFALIVALPFAVFAGGAIGVAGRQVKAKAACMLNGSCDAA